MIRQRSLQRQPRRGSNSCEPSRPQIPTTLSQRLRCSGVQLPPLAVALRERAQLEALDLLALVVGRALARGHRLSLERQRRRQLVASLVQASRKQSLSSSFLRIDHPPLAAMTCSTVVVSAVPGAQEHGRLDTAKRGRARQSMYQLTRPLRCLNNVSFRRLGLRQHGAWVMIQTQRPIHLWPRKMMLLDRNCQVRRAAASSVSRARSNSYRCRSCSRPPQVDSTRSCWTIRVNASHRQRGNVMQCARQHSWSRQGSSAHRQNVMAGAPKELLGLRPTCARFVGLGRPSGYQHAIGRRALRHRRHPLWEAACQRKAIGGRIRRLLTTPPRSVPHRSASRPLSLASALAITRRRPAPCVRAPLRSSCARCVLRLPAVCSWAPQRTLRRCRCLLQCPQAHQRLEHLRQASRHKVLLVLGPWQSHRRLVALFHSLLTQPHMAFRHQQVSAAAARQASSVLGRRVHS